jgi:hypothetical protein
MIKGLTLILAVALLAVSCTRGVSRIRTRPLPQPNPTSCSFPLPLADVRDRALEAFSIEHQVNQPIFGRSAITMHFEDILSAECATNAVFAKAVFRDPANTNDIYLHTFDMPFVTSSVYCGRNGGLPFIAAFHLHLTSSGSNTLVKVTALDTQVVNGEKFGVGPCGPGYGWIFEKVQPTTVEEYSILRYLGYYLGVTNMPEVILPEP